MTQIIARVRLGSASGKAESLERRREPSIMFGFAHRRPSMRDALVRAELRVRLEHDAIDFAQLAVSRPDEFGLLGEYCHQWPVPVGIDRPLGRLIDRPCGPLHSAASCIAACPSVALCAAKNVSRKWLVEQTVAAL